MCARVLDIEAFISRCLETTCTCLEHSLDNHTAEEECRCHAMQAFVVDCLSADSSIDLSDWRMQQDCRKFCYKITASFINLTINTIWWNHL